MFQLLKWNKQQQTIAYYQHVTILITPTTTSIRTCIDLISFPSTQAAAILPHYGNMAVSERSSNIFFVFLFFHLSPLSYLFIYLFDFYLQHELEVMNRSSLYINKFEADLDVSFLQTLPNSLLREKRANMNYLCNALQLFKIFVITSIRD